MSEFKDFTKPPLGACPAYIRSADRIAELAQAISRTALDGPAKHYVGHISLWAKEILMHVDIIEYYERETSGKALD